ncbi:MAG TPA: FHA domain-containing protein [Actinomycetota bacterium]|nr:FHA domain-containing protein [Actinomycetota bacterium]
MFCSRCGHPNRDDARFCVECGHPLHEDVTVSLAAIEPEEEASEEFPFPNDTLNPGQALLLVKRGPNAGSTFLLEGDETTVGRDTDSAVFLDDVTVSRKHAVVERHGDEWFVVDRGSLNGTYVNGEQVDRTKLATGDEVQIGRFKLTFFAADR